VTIRATLTNTHQLNTKTPDGKDLVFLTGTAIADFVGTSGDWRRDSLAIHVSPPIWQANGIEDCAPVVALAALWNGSYAVNAGWAVDWTDWTTYAWPGEGPHLLITSGLAVSDTDGYLIRVSYQATVLGRLA